MYILIGFITCIIIILITIEVLTNLYYPWKFYHSQKTEEKPSLIYLIEYNKDVYLKRSKWWRIWE